MTQRRPAAWSAPSIFKVPPCGCGAPRAGPSLTPADPRAREPAPASEGGGGGGLGFTVIIIIICARMLPGGQNTVTNQNHRWKIGDGSNVVRRRVKAREGSCRLVQAGFPSS